MGMSRKITHQEGTKTMKTVTKATTLGLLAAIAAMAVSAPVLADPDSQQKNKNNWRNLGVVGAAIAGYGLLTHNQNATLLGAAGAAYSANRYEQDRQHQSQDNANRQRYYRNGGYGYGRTYGWNPTPSYNNGGYNNGGYDSNNGYSNSGYDNNRDSHENAGYGDGSAQAFARHDNRD